MASSARKLDLSRGSRDLPDGSQGPGGTPRLLRRRPRAARLLRIERPLLGEDRVWEREVRALPAELLPALPLPVTLRLEVRGVAEVVTVATSDGTARAEREAGALVLDAAEWSALVSATTNDRLWPSDLRAICARKALDPSFVLDARVALGGARPFEATGRTLGWVLDRLGARLLRAEC